MLLPNKKVSRFIKSLPFSKLSIQTSVSTLALSAAFLMTASPAQAGCDDNNPTPGTTVTCDASAPNPDTVGVQRIGATAADDLAVILEAGASIAITGTNSGIEAGPGATITMASGSSISSDGFGIALFDGDPANPSSITINGSITAGHGVFDFSGGTFTLGQTGIITSVNEALFSRNGDNVIDINGTLLRTGGIIEGVGVITNLGGNARLTLGSTGSISSSQDGIAGIVAFGGNNLINIAGDIRLTGNVRAFDNETYFAAGILADQGAANTFNILNGGSITTTQSDSVGIAALSNVNTNADYVVNIAAGGLVDVSGLNSIGVLFGNIYNVDMPENRLEGFTNTLDNAGTIISNDTTAFGGGVAIASGGAVITNRAGGSITGATGIGIESAEQDDVYIINAGTITGTGEDRDAIFRFTDGGDDTLEIRPGSVINGNVDLADGDNTLVFGGDSGSDTFNWSLIDGANGGSSARQYFNFDAFRKTGASTWTINGGQNGGAPVTFDVVGGTAIIDGQLRSSDFTVGSGARLEGSGSLGNVTIGTGGTLALNGSMGLLTTENLVLSAGSIFEVNVNDAGAANEVVFVRGTVTLGDATLRVLDMAGGNFAGTNPYNYTIIANVGASAVSGTFGTITNQLAFLTPTVSYTGGDGNDVTLTLTPNNMGGGGGVAGCTPVATSGMDSICSGAVGPNAFGNAFGGAAFGGTLPTDVGVTVLGNATLTANNNWAIELGSGTRFVITEEGSVLQSGIEVFGSIATQITHGGSLSTTDIEGIVVSDRNFISDSVGVPSVHITATGSVRTSGIFNEAVSVDHFQLAGPFSQSEILVDGVIETLGEGSVGITTLTGGAARVDQRIEINGSVTTQGRDAFGIEHQSNQSFDEYPASLPDRRRDIDILVNGQLGTGGRGAHGIAVQSQSNSENLILRVSDGGEVLTSGQFASAIVFEARDPSFRAVDPADAAGFINAPSVSVPASITIDAGGRVHSAQGATIIDEETLEGRGYDTTLTVGGTLSTGVTNGDAALLGAGTDTLVLLPTYSITGSVRGGSGTDVFVLDGASGTSGSFNAGTVNLNDFELFEKRGAGQWTWLDQAVHVVSCDREGSRRPFDSQWLIL